MVKAFKAARLFSPHILSEDIDILRAFPFLDNEVNSLQAELPTYLSLSADVSTDTDTLKWWKDHHEDLPHWSSAIQKLFLVQPSSAAAERYFLCLRMPLVNNNRVLFATLPLLCITVNSNQGPKNRVGLQTALRQEFV